MIVFKKNYGKNNRSKFERKINESVHMFLKYGTIAIFVEKGLLEYRIQKTGFSTLAVKCGISNHLTEDIELDKRGDNFQITKYYITPIK
ncbi:MAG: hypothetical protein ACOC4J_00780 [Bacteroidota bacterium]